MAQTMAEYLFQQGQERGEKRGELRAKRETLLKLIALRFDTVPEPVANTVSKIRSVSRLNTLFEQVVTAKTIDEINWDND